MADIKVQYNKLSANCGLKVSNICLGTMNFGNDTMSYLPGLDQEKSVSLLNRFEELGGNFIDTANMYTRGDAESIIGKWLSSKEREKFVVATKCRSQVYPNDPNGQGLSRKHIIRALEDSLKRLQTDHIDLYQVHWPDPDTPIMETIRTLEDLVRIGKVRYVGASNCLGWQLQKIMDVTKFMGFNQWVTHQEQYSLLCRYTEVDTFMVCKNEGLGILPWSPLKGGLLTGKAIRGKKPVEGSRLEWVTQDPDKRTFWISPNVNKQDDKVWNLLDKMDAISKEHKKSVAQVALRWALQRDPVTSVIIGASSVQQVDDNMAASTGWELSADQMKQLNDASAPNVPYPWDMSKNM